MHSLQLKLFLNLSDAEVAEVLENIQELQHIETFRELKKELLDKYELAQATKELNFIDDFTNFTDTEEPF